MGARPPRPGSGERSGSVRTFGRSRSRAEPVRWGRKTSTTEGNGPVRAYVVVDPGEGPIRTIRCAGELAVGSITGLRRAGEAVVSAPGVELLVVDVSGVTFVDSIGLNCLLTLNRTVSVVLAGPVPEQLRRLLRITGTDAVLPVVDTAPRHEGRKTMGPAPTHGEATGRHVDPGNPKGP